MSEDFNVEEVEAVCAKIDKYYHNFLADSEKATNKAGARRARKTSIDLAGFLKEYRKLSIK